MITTERADYVTIICRQCGEPLGVYRIENEPTSKQCPACRVVTTQIGDNDGYC